MTNLKINVIIADDNSFIREGMRIILTSFPEFDVLATVEDGAQAVVFCEQNVVDVALLDVRMPNMNGVEATQLLTSRTQTKPLILTTFDDDEYILNAIKYGAKGYLLKNNDPELIRSAIISVHKGHNVLQDAVLEKIKSNLTTDNGKVSSAERAVGFDASSYTEREMSVIELIAKGLSNKEISKRLFISEGTIANYVTSILGKSGLEHRTQIAVYYLSGEID
ncbi:DNA-binding response regulator, NarL/FixJ family, contains REC and HTH domains [Paenibacillus uliginis N3/975]|uniref:DNA-binding response regulator, NarL/FixJ family, contains REC and HTH domains n=1 Tax=Paenibacillus uliginis N3/975 TaxID=1313296 RepID=A0A1X7GTL7_9BACL|nr:response regulator transcription factor [Paenibacillus uliginis]SMF74531.1 DNA-binding response regulator, NarL/FixJ family, contains REC and HTH domains [Paenibacillus uliginis N3/975]